MTFAIALAAFVGSLCLIAGMIIGVVVLPRLREDPARDVICGLLTFAFLSGIGLFLVARW
jgi:hypothetical protein